MNARLALALLLGLVTACGQDTPLYPDRPTPAAWPDTISGTALIAPTLMPGEAPFDRAALPADLPWPACAPVIAAPAAFPAHFAPGFPVPPGLKLFKALTLPNDPGAVQIVGYAPLSYGDAVRFLLAALPAAGYTLERGDTEEGSEAESTFSGAGWRGGFRVATVMDCPAMTEWTVVVVQR